MKSVRKKIIKKTKMGSARVPRPSHIPALNLPEDADMLKDFSQEAQKHLMSARNSLLVLESVASDHEALDSIFKAFHTIKGLADFLKLTDIRDLSQATENLLDLTRKEVLEANNEMVALIGQVVERVQRLLELLDDQINNDGTFRGEYPSVGELIERLNARVALRASRVKIKPRKQKVLPIILEQENLLISDAISRTLTSSQKNVVLDRDVLQRWAKIFQRLNLDLKDYQNRLQERQQELIRERELSVRLTQQARQEARLKSEYLAHMAHEIRTLLSAIMGFTDLLKEANLNEKQREHLGTILLSGNMMFEIVNHILDYAKVEAGKLSMENIEFNLDRIIEDVFRVIRLRLLKKPIELYFNVSEQIPRFLTGDPTRLKQIFINLLDNAIKFTEKGEIGLEANLERIDSGEGKTRVATVRFIVRDTGIGIPKDRLNDIFESFTQASESTARLYGGSGLGLALCKRFITAMGGDIKVDSQLGAGTQFTFTLKFDIGIPESEKVDAPKYSGASILIVDRHEASTKTLEALCDKFKVKVLGTCRTAKQATEFLLKLETERRPLPSVVFIDTLFPDQEGFHLAKKIRQQERYRTIKLVAISSDVKIVNSPDYSGAMFDLFLAKPFISGEVADILARLLGDQLPATPVLSTKSRDKITCVGIRILVVEDSLPNRELLKVHFEALGCSCEYARNGQEAIEKLKKATFDVCFMDLQMPVMGGLEATKIIRQQLKSTMPIVALTAAEFQEEKDKCYELGMNDYLAKPFGPDQLKEKILKCINSAA